MEINPVGMADYGSKSTLFNGKLYYVSADSAHASELWVSDGTAAGTHVQFDVNTAFGTTGETLNELLVSAGKLFFSTAGPHGGRLYAGDGTVAGTVVAQEFTGERFNGAYNLTDANGTVLFQIPTSLITWRSDGTTTGTMPLEANPGQLVYFRGVVGSKWIFDYTTSLVATDGTTAGTVTLRNFDDTPRPLRDRSVAVIGDVMYLAEGTSATGTEVWRTDGTADGTTLVADVNPGPAGSSPHNITAFGSKLVFAADTGPTGIEPVILDPVAPRRTKFKLIHDFPGTQDSDPQPILTIGDSLFTIVEESEYHYSLFKTDGTAGGTTRVLADIGGYVTAAVNYGGLLFFTADGGFWRSDGTAQGTFRFAGGHYSSHYWQWLNIIDGTLYYIIQDHYEGHNQAGTLYAVDTPLASPRAVTSTGQSFFVPLVRDGLIYLKYVRYSPLRYQWYVTDGTTTTAIPNSNSTYWPGPGPQPPAAPAPAPPFSDSIVVKGTRYYAFDDGKHGTELWMDDGKHQKLLADLYKGPLSSSPDGLASVNGRLVFAAATPGFGRELLVVNFASQLSGPARPASAPFANNRILEQLNPALELNDPLLP
jgi:ELWxxDGT repeat protein